MTVVGSGIHAEAMRRQYTAPSVIDLETGKRRPGKVSIGGGNVATLRASEQMGRRCRVFIAHDLDEDNRALLRARKVSAVLHHDLRADANLAGRMIIQARGGLTGVTTVMSTIRVVTPHNLP